MTLKSKTFLTARLWVICALRSSHSESIQLLRVYSFIRRHIHVQLSVSQGDGPTRPVFDNSILIKQVGLKVRGSDMDRTL